MSLWLGPVIAIAFLAAPEAPAVRLQLEPNLRCELGDTIGSALTEQQVRVTAASDGSTWGLAVQRDGDAVLLRMTNAQGLVRAVRRLTPTQADCPALPRSVALLVKSWLAMRLTSTEAAEAIVKPAATPSAPATVRPTSSPQIASKAAGDSPSPSARSRASGRSPVQSGGASPVLSDEPAAPSTKLSEPSADPEPSAEQPFLAELRAPPAPEFFIAQPGVREPRPRSSQSFSAMLAGGGALGIGDSPVAMGMLTVELGFLEPWAIAIDAGAQTERRQTNGAAAVSVSLRWATLSLRRAFLADGIRGLHVSLGVQLAHLAARSDGFAVSKTLDLVVPTAAANVEWRQPISAGLFLLARLNIQARFQKQNFLIDSRVLVNVPEWGFGLTGGVGWNFL